MGLRYLSDETVRTEKANLPCDATGGLSSPIAVVLRLGVEFVDQVAVSEAVQKEPTGRDRREK